MPSASQASTASEGVDAGAGSRSGKLECKQEPGPRQGHASARQETPTSPCRASMLRIRMTDVLAFKRVRRVYVISQQSAECTTIHCIIIGSGHFSASLTCQGRRFSHRPFSRLRHGPKLLSLDDGLRIGLDIRAFAQAMPGSRAFL